MSANNAAFLDAQTSEFYHKLSSSLRDTTGDGVADSPSAYVTEDGRSLHGRINVHLPSLGANGLRVSSERPGAHLDLSSSPRQLQSFPDRKSYCQQPGATTTNSPSSLPAGMIASCSTPLDLTVPGLTASASVAAGVHEQCTGNGEVVSNVWLTARHTTDTCAAYVSFEQPTTLLGLHHQHSTRAAPASAALNLLETQCMRSVSTGSCLQHASIQQCSSVTGQAKMTANGVHLGLHTASGQPSPSSPSPTTPLHFALPPPALLQHQYRNNHRKVFGTVHDSPTQRQPFCASAPSAAPAADTWPSRAAVPAQTDCRAQSSQLTRLPLPLEPEAPIHERQVQQAGCPQQQQQQRQQLSEHSSQGHLDSQQRPEREEEDDDEDDEDYEDERKQQRRTGQKERNKQQTQRVQRRQRQQQESSKATMAFPSRPSGAGRLAEGGVNDGDGACTAAGGEADSGVVGEGAVAGDVLLPEPVEVTVGPHGVRVNARKRAREAAQTGRRSAAGRGGEADADEEDEDSDDVGTSSGRRRVRGGGWVRVGGSDPTRTGMQSVVGVFHPARYMSGLDCIQYEARFVSRSQFEKLGGSPMAKWYRSIRVLETCEPLGHWLRRHGLPVFTGKARRSRKRDYAAVADTGQERSGPEAADGVNDGTHNAADTASGRGDGDGGDGDVVMGGTRDVSGAPSGGSRTAATARGGSSLPSSSSIGHAVTGVEATATTSPTAGGHDGGGAATWAPLPRPQRVQGACAVRALDSAPPRTDEQPLSLQRQQLQLQVGRGESMVGTGSTQGLSPGSAPEGAAGGGFTAAAAAAVASDVLPTAFNLAAAEAAGVLPPGLTSTAYQAAVQVGEVLGSNPRPDGPGATSGASGAAAVAAVSAGCAVSPVTSQRRAAASLTLQGGDLPAPVSGLQAHLPSQQQQLSRLGPSTPTGNPPPAEHTQAPSAPTLFTSTYAQAPTSLAPKPCIAAAAVAYGVARGADPRWRQGPGLTTVGRPAAAAPAAPAAPASGWTPFAAAAQHAARAPDAAAPMVAAALEAAAVAAGRQRSLPFVTEPPAGAALSSRLSTKHERLLPAAFWPTAGPADGTAAAACKSAPGLHASPESPSPTPRMHATAAAASGTAAAAASSATPRDISNGGSSRAPTPIPPYMPPLRRLGVTAAGEASSEWSMPYNAPPQAHLPLPNPLLYQAGPHLAVAMPPEHQHHYPAVSPPPSAIMMGQASAPLPAVAGPGPAPGWSPPGPGPGYSPQSQQPTGRPLARPTKMASGAAQSEPPAQVQVHVSLQAPAQPQAHPQAGAPAAPGSQPSSLSPLPQLQPQTVAPRPVPPVPQIHPGADSAPPQSGGGTPTSVNHSQSLGSGVQSHAPPLASHAPTAAPTRDATTAESAPRPPSLPAAPFAFGHAAGQAHAVVAPGQHPAASQLSAAPNASTLRGGLPARPHGAPPHGYWAYHPYPGLPRAGSLPLQPMGHPLAPRPLYRGPYPHPREMQVPVPLAIGVGALPLPFPPAPPPPAGYPYGGYYYPPPYHRQAAGAYRRPLAVAALPPGEFEGVPYPLPGYCHDGYPAAAAAGPGPGPAALYHGSAVDGWDYVPSHDVRYAGAVVAHHGATAEPGAAVDGAAISPRPSAGPAAPSGSGIGPSTRPAAAMMPSEGPAAAAAAAALPPAAAMAAGEAPGIPLETARSAPAAAPAQLSTAGRSSSGGHHYAQQRTGLPGLYDSGYNPYDSGYNPYGSGYNLPVRNDGAVSGWDSGGGGVGGRGGGACPSSGWGLPVGPTPGSVHRVVTSQMSTAASAATAAAAAAGAAVATRPAMKPEGGLWRPQALGMQHQELLPHGSSRRPQDGEQPQIPPAQMQPQELLTHGPLRRLPEAGPQEGGLQLSPQLQPQKLGVGGLPMGPGGAAGAVGGVGSDWSIDAAWFHASWDL